MLGLIRITSTYVENTIGFLNDNSFVWDHLHIRGEYSELWWKIELRIGSPPHTWRIRYKLTETGHLVRITSTYVENTAPAVPDSAKLEDHLHIRGEYSKQIPL